MPNPDPRNETQFLLEKEEDWKTATEKRWAGLNPGANATIQWAVKWIQDIRKDSEYEEMRCPSMFLHGGMLKCKWPMRNPDVYPTLIFPLTRKGIYMYMDIGYAAHMTIGGMRTPEEFKAIVAEADRINKQSDETRALFKLGEWDIY